MGRYPAIEPVKLDGTELISDGETVIGTVCEYWSWAHVDLVDNTERGAFAEFIVHKAVGAESKTRANWDRYDILSPEGIAIEVKSSGYLQSWDQEKLSSITFSIRPTHGWDRNVNSYDKEQTRQSVVYVFCLQSHKEQKTLNPLDASQWEFYVLPTAVLDEKVHNQQSIGLDSLKKLGAVRCVYSELRETILKQAKGMAAIDRGSIIRYTNKQFQLVVYNTAQWINAVCKEDHRCRVESKKTSGDFREPWNKRDENRIYWPERTLLITSVYHAVKGLRIINRVVGEYGDHSIEEFLDEIYHAASWTKIKNLRDMNEHSDEYVAGAGKKQNAFTSKVEYKGKKLPTNAFMTYEFDHGKDRYFGNSDINALIKVIRKCRKKMQEKLRILFFGLSGLDNNWLTVEEFEKLVVRIKDIEKYESSSKDNGK